MSEAEDRSGYRIAVLWDFQNAAQKEDWDVAALSRLTTKRRKMEVASTVRIKKKQAKTVAQ